MEIRSLADTRFETLFEAFTAAFAGYEMQLDAMQLRRMLRRRGYDPRLSFGAFEEGRLAAFTLNGIGRHNGAATAYDTGTGTREAYRGRGLATAIFEHSIPYLQAAGVEQYLLEVLQHNTKAVSVYRKLGFETRREFNYFSQETARIDCRTAAPDFPCSIRRIDLARCGTMARFWDFEPSWQNSPQSVERASDDFIGLGVFAGEELAGYCIFEPATGDLTQIGVDRRFRRRGVGSLLLREMIRLNASDIVKVVNTLTTSDAITRFLEKRNIPVRGKQFEMIRTI